MANHDVAFPSLFELNRLRNIPSSSDCQTIRTLRCHNRQSFAGVRASFLRFKPRVSSELCKNILIGLLLFRSARWAGGGWRRTPRLRRGFTTVLPLNDKSPICGRTFCFGRLGLWCRLRSSCGGWGRVSHVRLDRCAATLRPSNDSRPVGRHSSCATRFLLLRRCNARSGRRFARTRTRAGRALPNFLDSLDDLGQVRKGPSSSTICSCR